MHWVFIFVRSVFLVYLRQPSWHLLASAFLPLPALLPHAVASLGAFAQPKATVVHTHTHVIYDR